LPTKPHVVVIGSGIAGLSTAWHLRHQARLTILEAGDRLGGHTHTRSIAINGVSGPVDTGFIVFNHQTYPLFTPWLAELGVQTSASDMSFSVSVDEGAFEWSGSNLRSVFAQPTNALRPSFWLMLREILRFNKKAPEDSAAMLTGTKQSVCLGDYLDAEGYSERFQRAYLLPMAGAIWSCPTETMRGYPLTSFVRFCSNHGLLQVQNRPTWYTLSHGSASYIDAMLNRMQAEEVMPELRLNAKVESVTPRPTGFNAESGRPLHGLAIAGQDPKTGLAFTLNADAVVLACHADQAARILRETDHPALPLLHAIGFQPNKAYLHLDASLMPRRRAAWASWNYLSQTGQKASSAVSVTYWMNRLQPLVFSDDVFVSLNPHRPPDPSKTLEEVSYEHPIFNEAAVEAQTGLAARQGSQGVWFAGAWTGFGFHEDGFRAGKLAAESLISDVCAAPQALARAA
jgi:predicted NAD/FAD-binding protein